MHETRGYLLCQGGEAEYTDLFYYTEVRWLSRGNVLNQVWTLKTEVDIFMVDQTIFSQISFKVSAREIVSAFGLKLQYWTQKVEQNNILSNSESGF